MMREAHIVVTDNAPFVRGSLVAVKRLSLDRERVLAKLIVGESKTAHSQKHRIVRVDDLKEITDVEDV